MKNELAPLARTNKDFIGTPPDMPDNTPLIDTFGDEELEKYFTDRLFVQAHIGLSGEQFPGTTPENLQGIRERTIASLKVDIKYAQSRGRIVPAAVLKYFRKTTYNT